MSADTTFQFINHAERQFSEVAELSMAREQDSSVRSGPLWGSWDELPCVVLLGQPGSGKSSEFRFQLESLKHAGETAFLSRWRDWCHGEDIFSTLDNPEDFMDCLQRGEKVWWFLDALDEGRIKSENAFDELKRGLQRLKKENILHLVKLRLSCRAQDWRSSESNKLASLFGGNTTLDGIVTLQLQPLDQAAIRLLSAEKLGAESVDSFLSAVEHRNVSNLTGFPLLLGLMLRLYKSSGGALSDDRTGIYQDAARKLVTERNEEYIGGRVWKLFPNDRLHIARRIAVHFVLGGYSSIHLPEDNSDDKGLDLSMLGMERDDVIETISSAMFLQGFRNGFEFFHRSFAEFLAAWEIAERVKEGLSLARVKPLFPLIHGALPSPVRETATWLAGLSAEFRSWLLSVDPVSVAQGDSIRYSPDERKQLIQVLAERFSGRTWQREIDRFGDLAKAVPEADLSELLAPKQGLAVRTMVLSMIEAADIRGMLPEISSIALNSSDNVSVRHVAISTLTELAPAEYKEPLVSLLSLPESEDPSDELAGAVLRGLFPKNMTVEEALSGLRLPRNDRLLGDFRWFWEKDFEENLSNTSQDRITVLEAISGLLVQFEDVLALRPFSSLYIRLLIREIKGRPKDIEHLGPWLVHIRDAIDHIGAPEQHVYDALVNTVEAIPGFRASLLTWCLRTWPPEKEFYPWSHLPLHQHHKATDDFSNWLSLCRLYADNPRIGPNLFQELVNIANCSPGLCLYAEVDRLCEELPAYQPIWESNRYCLLDSKLAESRRRSRERNQASAQKWDNFTVDIQARTDLIEAGDINLLWTIVIRAQCELFGAAPVGQVEERFGPAVAVAVRKGLVAVWENLADTSYLWPRSHQQLHQAICAGMGFREKHPNDSPILSLTDAQADFLIWRAMERDKHFAELMPVLWSRHHTRTLTRLLETLSSESKLQKTDHPLVWSLLARQKLDPSLAKAIEAMLREVGLPDHTKARRAALIIGLKSNLAGIIELANVAVAEEWRTDYEPLVSMEPAALLSLAASWLKNPDNYWDILTRVMEGPRHHDRAISFIGALQDFGEGSEFSPVWLPLVSLETYARLLPLLFANNAPPAEELDGYVTHDQAFRHARSDLILMLFNSPWDGARDAFARWKDDPLFDPHRDWIANLYRQLERRLADETWIRLEVSAVDSILQGGAALVQSDADFALLIGDLIDHELTEAFRSDFSLVPLLWQGKKSAGPRKAHDEKVLQAVTYGQLMPFLLKQRTIGAREPEVLDAKKPDAQLSCVLPNGDTARIPIEIKWAWHSELWTAPLNQLLGKYMQTASTRHGIYLVAWGGLGSNPIPRGPNGEQPHSAASLLQQLSAVVARDIANSGKTITVHVLDASLPENP